MFYTLGRMKAPGFRRAFVTASLASLISLACVGIFFLLNAHSVARDLASSKVAIRAAFDNHTLGYELGRRGDAIMGQHQYNDCLVLMMAVDQRGTATELTVSPTQSSYGDPRGVCADTEHLAKGDAAVGEPAFYHQYMHGQTMLLRYLLPLMTVRSIRTLYKALMVLILFAGIAVALAGLAQQRSAQVNLFWLIMFLAFARCFGLETFGQSLSHAPSDLVFVGFALLLSIAAYRGGISSRLAIPLVAVFGSLTLIFEMLTGGIPLGLALIVGGLPFALKPGPDDEPPGRVISDVVNGLISFCAAVAAAIFTKAVAAIAVFGIDTIIISAQQLRLRMGLTGASGTGRSINPLQFVRSIGLGLDGLVPGTPLLGFLLLATAIFIGQWSARKLWRTPVPLLRLRVRCLVASNALIVLMLLVFWEHTIVHAWFMDRMLVWTVGSGFALFAMYLANHKTKL